MTDELLEQIKELWITGKLRWIQFEMADRIIADAEKLKAERDENERLRCGIKTLEEALIRDMGHGYAGVALCQALGDTNHEHHNRSNTESE